MYKRYQIRCVKGVTNLSTVCQRSDKSVLQQPLKLYLHNYRMIISLVGTYQPESGKQNDWVILMMISLLITDLTQSTVLS